MPSTAPDDQDHDRVRSLPRTVLLLLLFDQLSQQVLNGGHVRLHLLHVLLHHLLALLLDDTLVDEAVLPRESRVAQSFAPELQQAFRQAGWSPRQVDLFAICHGPGSFTGLRIAVASGVLFRRGRWKGVSDWL